MEYAFLIVNGEVFMVSVETARDCVYIRETNVMDGNSIIEMPDVEAYLERHPDLIKDLERGDSVIVQ